jgi:hypothetical protein
VSYLGHSVHAEGKHMRTHCCGCPLVCHGRELLLSMTFMVPTLRRLVKGDAKLLSVTGAVRVDVEHRSRPRRRFARRHISRSGCRTLTGLSYCAGCLLIRRWFRCARLHGAVWTALGVCWLPFRLRSPHGGSLTAPVFAHVVQVRLRLPLTGQSDSWVFAQYIMHHAIRALRGPRGCQTPREYGASR